MRRAPDWFGLEKFEYVPLSERSAVMSLLAVVSDRTPGAALRNPSLNVQGRGALRSYRALLDTAQPPIRNGSADTPRRAADELLWQVTFGLPLEVIESPHALFELATSDGLLIALPAPDGPACEYARRRSGRTLRMQPPRRLTAMATALLVTAGSGLGPAAAVAVAPTVAGPAHIDPRCMMVPRPPTAPANCPPLPTVHAPAAPPPSPPESPAAARPAASHAAAPAPRSAGTRSDPQVARNSAHGGFDNATSGGTAAGGRKRHAAAGGGAVVVTAPPPRPQSSAPPVPQSSTPGLVLPGSSHHATKPHAPAPKLISQPANTKPAPSLASIPAPSIGSNALALSQLAADFANVEGPPPFLIPIYKRAGRHYHIPWQVLAAINSVETNYGRNLSTSSAGAIGWMQFMPATWAQYGVAVGHKGKPDPYDPTDAIFAAARYLAANGGQHNIRKAVFAYNHATWYVDEVMLRSQVIKDTSGRYANPRGYALPLDPHYMRQLGRTDDGVDIEDAPDGAFVYSITTGVVSAVASDPAGFGPNYPVVLATNGPVAGKYIYYGHVAVSLVHAGQHVRAGQPIAIMGHTGDAASLGHGHIEIGFSDASGDPLSHHSATAWTPDGNNMRTFLVALSAKFHIHNS
jgi:murein DD-endopeptidase MepM/ murein hydrolase activator NlpD